MKRCALALGLVALFIACATKKKVDIKPVEGLEEVTVYEETTAVVTPTPTPGETTTAVVPVTPVEPVVTIPTAETTQAYTPPTPMVPITPATPPQTPPSVFGFRVQIFASSSRENAERISSDAQKSLADKIYVEAEENLFKVRLGDFVTREDADKLKARVVKLGFKGSFVVETMVSPR